MFASTFLAQASQCHVVVACSCCCCCIFCRWDGMSSSEAVWSLWRSWKADAPKSYRFYVAPPSSTCLFTATFSTECICIGRSISKMPWTRLRLIFSCFNDLRINDAGGVYVASVSQPTPGMPIRFSLFPQGDSLPAVILLAAGL